MSAPNLTINVEPSESGKVVYLPLAAQTKTQLPTARLVLLLSIKNNEGLTIKMKDLTLSFVGGSQVNADPIPLQFIDDKGISHDFEIGTGQTGTWWFQTPDQDLILPVPTPDKVKINVSAHAFDKPATLTLPLAAHKSPTPNGSYLFPARANDLRIMEYWTTDGDSHPMGVQGSQSFAYDMRVVGWDIDTKKWTALLPDTSGKKNTDYRIWGKPIYAMADGIVRQCANDVPTNPDPPTYETNLYQTGKTKIGSGNHFYIQHGDEVMQYAHMQAGSLTPEFCHIGAKVKVGDLLGLAGNSGNSSGPHLHIHSIQGAKPEEGPLRPILFREAYVIDRSAFTPPDPTGPWVKMNGHGIPTVKSAIWPTKTTPTWYPPGWPEIARHGIPESSYQTEFEHIVDSGYRPVWIDGYDVNGKTFFNAIFRPANGTAWASHHGLTAAQYQAEFDTQNHAGLRPLHIESYLSGGHICYATIFVKSPGPAWNAYHGKTAAEHKKLFDELTADGWRPVIISVVSVGGERMHTALYEKENVGSFFTQNFLTADEYQTAFNDNDKAGRKLVYLNAYNHHGAPRFTAIWHSKAHAPAARHGMSSSEYQTEWQKQTANGLLTRAVTAYESGDKAIFAAFWSK